jgi:hypothetical protein
MLWPLLLPALESRPHLTATRVTDPPVLDGKLDDPAWAKAEATSSFIQKFPDEGQPVTEKTTLRIVYDDEAVYVGFDCEQTRSRVVQRLTRRGRLVESDWVSIAFGTRGDGKSAFEFLVNAAGVRVDALRFNDIEKTEDRDENWEAQTRLTLHGWSAEIKIPLHILRFSGGRDEAWALQARRYISERQETDEWAFFPRSVGGEVSNYGKLGGLHELKAKAPIEVRPFVLGKIERREKASYLAGEGTNPSGSAGLDLKWHPSHDLTLDLTLNPDFAQVEADQVVLNLSSYETFYPEKRPFFLEGTDIFSTPIQLLYTRRIGRAPKWPMLRDGETLVDPPVARTIYGASKLTGGLGNGWSVGTLQAVSGASSVDVELADGSRVSRRAEPLSGHQVVRVRRDIGDRASIGFTGTATTYAESTGGYPLDGPFQLCPNAVDEVRPVQSLSPSSGSGPFREVVPGARCFQDAFVGGLDWRWRSPGGDWSFTGQGVASMLHGAAPRHVVDGTTIRSGDVGTALATALAKEGGAHWIGEVRGEYLGRRFDPNDLGFSPRSNLYRLRSAVEYRELERHGPFLEFHGRAEYFEKFNLDGLDIGGGYHLASFGKLSSFWNYFSQFLYHRHFYDDREVGNGTAMERAAFLGYELWFETDRTKPVSLELWNFVQSRANGWSYTMEGGALFRVLPALDLSILPTASYTKGEPRFIGQNVPGQYIFGRLAAASIGSTFRATYTFTPRLTLQAYAQLLLASGHYTEPSSIDVDPAAPKPVVRLVDMRPYAGPLDNPDFVDGVLNINVVFRWEYQLGSIAYLVYTRAQSPDVTLNPGEAATLRLSNVTRGPAIDVLLLKLSYWWG